MVKDDDAAFISRVHGRFQASDAMKRANPEVIELDTKKLEEILHRVEINRATAEDHQTIRTLSESYVHLLALLKDKSIKIGRLRKLLFGASTEKTETVLGDKTDGSTSSASGGDDLEPSEQADQKDQSKPPPKGHGRNGADDYPGAEQIQVPHESLEPGDPCPDCQKGTVYEMDKPGVLIRLVGQTPVGAKVYRLQKLRCNLCCEIFTAQTPEGVGTEKYDATVCSMIGLLKYGCGFPFNRSDRLQGDMGVPLPTSTQWEIVQAGAEQIEPAHSQLILEAAQGDVLYNDDTTVRILELMGKRAEQTSREGSADDSADKKKSGRRGLFTSGIVSTSEGRRIALFFTGRKHAGENLADVLRRRVVELDAPVQMCDGLSRNLPGELKTIVANCLTHARRKFVDVVDDFSEECGHVLEAFRVIYHNDAIGREQDLSPEARLQLHQAESGPVMEELHGWLTRQFDERLVETNSALGKAIRYLLKHWKKLTLFLRKAGAPLDNNICERALKKSVLHRKAAMFYKTENGAHVGDLYMSLIHTCQLSEANPFDYLTELQRHADELAASPRDWMPWNYRQTLAASTACEAAR